MNVPSYPLKCSVIAILKLPKLQPQIPMLRYLSVMYMHIRLMLAQRDIRDVQAMSCSVRDKYVKSIHEQDVVCQSRAGVCYQEGEFQKPLITIVSQPFNEK